MTQKEDIKQHYKSPIVSELEQKLARKYMKAYAKECYFEGFGDFLFPVRIPSENLKDSHESRGATDVYDEQLLEIYALGLAKAEIEASKANKKNVSDVLDNILSAKEDFFLDELEKRDKWHKYLTRDCITGWYDDKRRAALRGFAKKGITLKEKVEETSAPIASITKQKRFWPLYALTITNTIAVIALGIGALIGYSKFEDQAQNMETKVNTSIKKMEYNLKPENIFSSAETYLRSKEGQKQVNRVYAEFRIWWQKEDLAVDELNKFWEDTVAPNIKEMNSPEQGKIIANAVSEELERRYHLKTTAEQLQRFAKMFGNSQSEGK